jgi:hypothetical protein
MKTIIFKEEVKMSDKYELVLNTKNIRKVAFAVGFGLTLGKMAGGIVDSALKGVVRGTLKIMAGKGNEIAQIICKEADVKYNDKSQHEEESEKVKMGFHV